MEAITFTSIMFAYMATCITGPPAIKIISNGFTLEISLQLLIVVGLFLRVLYRGNPERPMRRLEGACVCQGCTKRPDSEDKRKYVGEFGVSEPRDPK